MPQTESSIPSTAADGFIDELRSISILYLQTLGEDRSYHEQKGRAALIRLIESHADIRLASCSDGRVPALCYVFQSLITRDFVPQAEFLLKAGLLTRAGQAYTPLIDAVRARHVSIAKLLLAYGHNPESGRVEGMTPLSAAAKGADAEMIAVLLQAGADPLQRDNNGTLPLELLVTESQAGKAPESNAARLEDAAQGLVAATFAPGLWQTRSLEEAAQLFGQVPCAWRKYADISEMRRRLHVSAPPPPRPNPALQR